ncbi:dihydrolipoamide acetyltransferase family protein [Mucilaginibacter segetis]|uniref:Dihydrolipoamide acetyltransferase component of pyruvate dehydrogenase complex n=1 Tax=Mucilaginibacter segetis TaxID=2793071 RepID=A0A934PU81_9SPHI|nr:dihydrolipoamide acetyltransferase family protein [Mucilaginibacter segetis]MBK0379485.1 2-oxo acid dehydrogenase subunit E2 [Mucilaginibacter segetis]
MAKYQLLLPKMGESVAEATIIKWTKSPGDYVEADEAVMEIATDKVDSEVPSPVSGKLIEQLCKEDEVVQVGAVIAIIETDEPEQETSPVTTDTEAASTSVQQPQEIQPVEEKDVEDIPGIDQLDQPTDKSIKFENRFYSPLVKSIASQEDIGNDELDTIPGTGAEGRLTKDDLLDYIQNKPHKKAEPVTSNRTENTEAPQQNFTEPSPKESEKPQVTEPKVQQHYTPKPTSEATKPSASVGGADEIIEMDRMRRLIADHMVYSKHTSPHVTSFIEVDVTELVQWREGIKNSFQKREGEKITFTPIFIEAVVNAIKELPMINVSVNGTQIIKKKDINISMATALPSGNLIVPVIKKADELSLLGLTKAVNDLANRARNNKLQPDDVKDGTFTITNVGTFGNVMGTPIINQPQVAILAVGAIKKKPAVIETPQGDTIGVRHMMFLSLSYDHRVVDGALGGTFIKKVADYLEKWDISRNI